LENPIILIEILGIGSLIKGGVLILVPRTIKNHNILIINYLSNLNLILIESQKALANVCL